jgi:hypothetical protein
MLEFLCGVPGADPATVTWHALVHLSLTAFVTVTGSGFMAAAVVAHRRSGRRIDRSG